MELTKKRHWPYILTALWLFILVVLGGWWMYLVFQFGSVLEAHSITPPIEAERFYSMIKWEGATFFVLLFFISLSLVYLNLQDSKKNHAMASFFASLTHELKTPLASIRLQSEFLEDLIQQKDINKDQCKKLTQRLVQDVNSLENSLDKSLQLARIHKKANLSLSPVKLSVLLERIQYKYHNEIDIQITGAKDSIILAEEMALSMILKNLIENTLRHQPGSKHIRIEIIDRGQRLSLRYDDEGKPFEGNIKNLGKLFYKHKSPKGTGIGLYIVKELTKRLKGNFKLISTPNLIFELDFLKEGEQ